MYTLVFPFYTVCLTDHTKCKLTRKGTEYVGTVSETIFGNICQNLLGISDSEFPDGDVESARNYCRNPRNRFNLGHWCYTLNPDSVGGTKMPLLAMYLAKFRHFASNYNCILFLKNKQVIIFFASNYGLH